MYIKNNNTQEIGEFLAWNLAPNELPSYVLVKLNDGNIREWKIMYCSIIDSFCNPDNRIISSEKILQKVIDDLEYIYHYINSTNSISKHSECLRYISLSIKNIKKLRSILHEK